MSEVDIFSLRNSINDSDITTVLNKVSTASFNQQEVYLGCSDGWLYQIENQILNDVEENSFVTSIIQSLHVLENHPILKIEHCRLLNTICVLINESIIFVDENPLLIKPINVRLKNVSTFAISEQIVNNNEYITEICIGSSQKKILLYNMTSVDKVILVKEINVSSVPYTLSFNKEVVCMASEAGAYSIINFETNECTDLFQLTTTNNIKPHIALVSDQTNGFILLGPDGLGIFADQNGASQTPPIQWSSTIRDFVYEHSFILAVDHEFITIHSVASQTQLQTIHFPNSTNCKLYPSNSGSCLILSNHQSNWRLHQLHPCSLNEQAIQLLNQKKPEKAITLAIKMIKTSSNEKESKLAHIKARAIFNIAGFQMFREGRMNEAKKLFEKGKVDLRELIICYPGILPKSYRFDASIATQESGFRLDDAIANDKSKMTQYKQFLLDILLENRESKSIMAFSQIIETALIKLYVDLDPQKVYLNLTMMLSDVDYEDLIDYLQQNKYFHTCGIVMKWYDQLATAVEIWGKLARKEIEDEQFPGFEFLKEVLFNVPDPKIIVNNLEWIISYDSEFAKAMLSQFIHQYHAESDVIGCLLGNNQSESNEDNFSKTGGVLPIIESHSSIKYEFLSTLSVYGLLKDHSLADCLGQMFLEKLQQQLNENSLESFQETRAQLIEFLLLNSNYNCSKLLGMIRQFNNQCDSHSVTPTDPWKLIKEEAVILGRTGSHTQAISLLVQFIDETDRQFARRYCLEFSRPDSVKGQSGGGSPKENLFLKLLKAYLEHCYDGSDNQYKLASLELLQFYSKEIEIKEVISVLPSSWPLDRLENYLRSALSRIHQAHLSACMNAALVTINCVKTAKEANLKNNSAKLILGDDRTSNNSNESKLKSNCRACGEAFNGADADIILRQSDRPDFLFHKHCFDAHAI